jgi:putative Ca2+/H+ antiporter (TMEM165/GDT1 family)
MLLLAAQHGFPNWGIAAIAIGALLILFFAANLVGNVLGFLVKNVVVLGVVGVGFFFAAPYVLGKDRGDNLQARVKSTLHLQSLTSCSKAFNSIGTDNTATRISHCNNDAKKDVKTQTHKLRVKVGK